jgi:predicted metal-binding membrane protein
MSDMRGKVTSSAARITTTPGAPARATWQAGASHCAGPGITGMTSASGAARPAVLAATLGLSAACWVLAVRLMSGMGMGTATRLGSFGAFIAMWAAMMAAMMLPGAAPAVVRRARAGGGADAVLVFVASYLAVWALVGVVAFAVDRPHGALAAGLVVMAAGAYEITPVKRHCRRRCRESIRSGAGFGLYCAGSSAGLMAMLVALGVMSIIWMSVIAGVVLAQKLMPVKAAFDVPLAAAMTGFGILIIFAPSAVPGLTPPMY